MCFITVIPINYKKTDVKFIPKRPAPQQKSNSTQLDESDKTRSALGSEWQTQCSIIF